MEQIRITKKRYHNNIKSIIGHYDWCDVDSIRNRIVREEADAQFVMSFDNSYLNQLDTKVKVATCEDCDFFIEKINVFFDEDIEEIIKEKDETIKRLESTLLLKTSSNVDFEKSINLFKKIQKENIDFFEPEFLPSGNFKTKFDKFHSYHGGNDFVDRDTVISIIEDILENKLSGDEVYYILPEDCIDLLNEYN